MTRFVIKNPLEHSASIPHDAAIIRMAITCIATAFLLRNGNSFLAIMDTIFPMK